MNEQLCTLCYFWFRFKQIDPTLTTLKLTHFEWVDFNSKLKFAICHWSWEIGCIWHFLRKSGDINRAMQWATLRELEKLVLSYQMWKSIKDPNFLKKCQMQPISQDQWQIAKFILEFKSTHPKCVNFDGVRVGSICLHLNQI